MYWYISTSKDWVALGAHVQEGYGSCLCLSVKSNLTSGACVHPKILSRTQCATEVKNLCFFFWNCSITEIEHSVHWRPYVQLAIFLRKVHVYYSIYHVVVDCSGGTEERVGHELSFMSCYWSWLQTRSAHNGMNSWHRGFCTLVHLFCGYWVMLLQEEDEEHGQNVEIIFCTSYITTQPTGYFFTYSSPWYHEKWNQLQIESENDLVWFSMGIDHSNPYTTVLCDTGI